MREHELVNIIWPVLAPGQRQNSYVDVNLQYSTLEELYVMFYVYERETKIWSQVSLVQSVKRWALHRRLPNANEKGKLLLYASFCDWAIIKRYLCVKQWSFYVDGYEIRLRTKYFHRSVSYKIQDLYKIYDKRFNQKHNGKIIKLKTWAYMLKEN